MSQLRASGARLAAKHEPADYTLYVNAPQTDEREFADLLARLSADLRAGRDPLLEAAVADRR